MVGENVKILRIVEKLYIYIYIYIYIHIYIYIYQISLLFLITSHSLRPSVYLLSPSKLACIYSPA